MPPRKTTPKIFSAISTNEPVDTPGKWLIFVRNGIAAVLVYLGLMMTLYKIPIMYHAHIEKIPYPVIPGLPNAVPSKTPPLELLFHLVTATLLMLLMLIILPSKGKPSSMLRGFQVFLHLPFAVFVILNADHFADQPESIARILNLLPLGIMTLALYGSLTSPLSFAMPCFYKEVEYGFLSDCIYFVTLISPLILEAVYRLSLMCLGRIK